MRKNITVDELAKIGFEAYAVQAEGLTHDGKPIPKWEDLSDQTRDCWLQNAKAISVALVQDIDREWRKLFR